MRIKILLLGNDPVALVADAQLLRERGIMVYSAFNMDNIHEMILEVKPDLVFFDAHGSNQQITDVYNGMVNGIYFTNIPVVFTLSEDDVYLVTRKRTDSKDKRTIISDNMIDAIKMALRPAKKKTSHTAAAKSLKPGGRKDPGSQMTMQFYS